jgi:predicted CXXCH cytochrome family protein
VRLDHTGRLECTSCHDPHREFAPGVEGMFLVKTARGSELCRTCHASPATSAHANATAPLKNAKARAARFESPAAAGCAACHASHNADPGGRLVDRAASAREDDVCLDCHGTAATRVDIGRDLQKRSSHAIGGRGIHDAGEGPQSARPLPEVSAAAPRHATCTDCHDPHAAEARPAVAPAAGGALAGVWGIDLAGQRVQPVRFQYEVCFKCHADSVNRPQALGQSSPQAPQRARPETNLRMVFDPGAASFHPVAAPGRNPQVPGLVAPLNEGSLVYCTDCHASDSGAGVDPTGARGPHGSTYPTLLERNYETRDGTVESPAAYALCYKCHDRQVLLSPRSGFPSHARHVVQDRTPCSACHVAHGVPLRAGTPAGNHLVDFDVSIVRAGPTGPPRYDPAGRSCALTCHGRTHDQALRY